jgi:hypothetical protein
MPNLRLADADIALLIDYLDHESATATARKEPVESTAKPESASQR